MWFSTNGTGHGTSLPVVSRARFKRARPGLGKNINQLSMNTHRWTERGAISKCGTSHVAEITYERRTRTNIPCQNTDFAVTVPRAGLAGVLQYLNH